VTASQVIFTPSGRRGRFEPGTTVLDAARSLGVGARLLAAAEAWSRDAGFARMRVRSNVVRERAHRFYVREGYVERKRQVVFEKDLG